MERSALFRTYGTKGFVTGLVPDLWNVMKYKLYININIYVYCIYV